MTRNEILSVLSPEILAYIFPGYTIPADEPAGEAAEDGGIRFSKVGTDEAYREPVRQEKAGFFEGLRERLKGASKPDCPDIEPELDERAEEILAAYDALLAKYGVSAAELDSILGYRVKPSRLRISGSGRIFLTDFDDREVKMDPLSKAVFFLYLCHPEGLRYKELSDHRKELRDIYMWLSGRDDIPGMEKSIDDLVDPTRNSINEKVSRIKAAFCNVIGDRIARYYYITGNSGEKRRICLRRGMVEVEK